MRWLWLISVGVTDVQFPVWTKDEYGCWTGLYRFESGRTGIRTVHEGLLTLLNKGSLRYDSELPRQLGREEMRDLRLDFLVEPDTGDFAAAVRCDKQPDAYRIAKQANEIPNAQDAFLPLYCPKIEPLIEKARDIFADHSVSVLVLNTRRADDFGREASDEPIAAGPLVSAYLAERLALRWQDNGGRIPDALGPNLSTWIDILIDHEAIEDPEAQGRVVDRVNAALRAWNGGVSDERGVLVTTSGGMPLLKPLIERVPAIHFGQQCVRLLDQPERGANAAATALNYGDRVAERETLRFHCVEALRLGDYAGAYGLARRAKGRRWSSLVCDGLGPLLDLPGKPLHLKGAPVEPFVLYACQVEARLCMGDVVGSLMRLGPCIETMVWTLIGRDARVRELELRIDRANECLLGAIPRGHPLYFGQLLDPRQSSNGKGEHRVSGLSWEWPPWLAEPEGEQQQAGLALNMICFAYNASQQGGKSPREYRNLLAHGTDQIVDAEEIRQTLKKRDLINSSGQIFGENFISTKQMATLLRELQPNDLKSSMRAYLADILQQVIEG